MTQKEKISSLEEDLGKKNENLEALENNIKSLSADKERYESQLTSVRQVGILLNVFCQDPRLFKGK